MERQTKKVLICGDSFAGDDLRYPSLHFSQKIANSFPKIDWKIINFGGSGPSNRAIAQQMLQGMMYEPDFVILLFTAPNRIETERVTDIPSRSLNPEDIANWTRARYNLNTQSMLYVRSENGDSIVDQEVIDMQNIMTAGFCLEYLKNRNIDYCWMEGGLMTISKTIYEKNYIANPLLDHTLTQIPLNLWNHSNGTNDPDFHVDKEEIQESFANMCLNHILDSLAV